MQFIQNLIDTSKGSNMFNYQKANYYNYYRRLEHTQYAIGSRIGLIPKIPTDINNFILTDFIITGEITDSSVTTVFQQTYENKNEKPLECKYSMPLPPSASVSNFVIEYDGKVLTGKIKDNIKAQEKYSDSIASGNQAFLAELADDGLFNLTIGNLPPKKSVVINITIISEIGCHYESIHYCLHRLMFPKNLFKLTAKITFNLSTPISKVELDGYSPSIKYSDNKRKAVLEFNSSGVKKNIVVMVLPKLTDKPEYYMEQSKPDNTYAVALNFYPQFTIPKDEVEQKAEFIFVLDCSGSMSGKPIQNAKRALEIIMRSLNENVKFNIYIFGSSFRKLFNESKLYDDDSLASASEYIEKINANLGGTELLSPIKDILSSHYDPEYPKQLFILTDGEVSNRDQLIDYVGKESSSTRIFTLGIGGSVDKELVIGLSNACKGYYELIADNSKIESQVLSLLSIAMEPTLSNIKVDWSDNLKVTQAPKLVRPIYNNERMMIYGLVTKLNENDKVNITLTGNGPNGKVLSYPVVLDFSDTIIKSDSNQLHSLTVLNIIKDLEEDERKNKANNKLEIVRLSKKYSLISNHTSFLVTAESDQATIDTMETVDIMKQPYRVPITSSSIHSGGAGGGFGLSMRRSLSTASPQGNASSLSHPIPTRNSIGSGGRGGMSQGAVSKPRSVTPMTQNFEEKEGKLKDKESSKSNSKSQSTGDLLLDLIKSQKANGSWTSTPLSIPPSPQELSKLIPEVWITLFVISKIKKQFNDKSSQWDLIVQKAIKWIKSQLSKENLLGEFDKFEKLAHSSI